ncbi:MAG: ankyrin repeat domain-containing protein [Alphaproteobacteria bacterium]|nr:MAG: ankyrin repeat domain-containing protein [Alphaproteobacteria bacterium]
MDWSNVRKAIRKFFTNQQALDAKLVEAVRTGDLEKVTKALDKGGNPNTAANWKDENAFSIAIEAKNLDLVKLLLERGADPNKALGYRNNTPFLSAVRSGDNKIATALLEAKADVNTVTTDGTSALILAAAAGNTQLAWELLERGAEPDAPGNKGWTPLFYAARNGDTRTIGKLLSEGARTDRFDEEGRTVLDIARVHDRREAYSQIQAHIDTLSPEWVKTAEQEVAHVSIRRALGYRLTEIFNFETKQRTLIAHNYTTGLDSLTHSVFNETADKLVLDQAAAKLAEKKPSPQPAAQP